MPKLHPLRDSLIVGLIAALAPASASVLTFDITGNPLNTAIDQNYGDRVSAATMGAFGYGTAGGFTPNVVVDYTPSDVDSPTECAFDATNCIYTWDTGFSDLTNVISQSSRGSNNGLTVLTFSADPGFFVSLTSLELGYYFYPGGNTTEDINGVTVYDASNAVVFSSGPLTIDSILRSSVSIGVTSSVLTVVIDARNAPVGVGELIGIDNVEFGQISEAPEPASFLMVGGALVAAGLASRFRKAKA